MTLHKKQQPLLCVVSRPRWLVYAHNIADAAACSIEMTLQVGCVINGTNVWANVQRSAKPWEMTWDTRQASCTITAPHPVVAALYITCVKFATDAASRRSATAAHMQITIKSAVCIVL